MKFRLITLLGLYLGLAATLPAQEESSPWDIIDPSERVTLNYKDEDLVSILDTFSSTYQLNMVYGQNVTGQVTLNLFDVTPQQALEKILATSGYTYVVEGNFIVIQPVGGANQRSGNNPSIHEPRIVYLNHVRAKDVVPMIMPLLKSDELVVEGPQSESGIEEVTRLGGNAQATREMVLLLVSDESFDKVRLLLEQLDIPPPQVLVEATILQVSLTDNFKFGVDFTALGGIDFQALRGITDVTDQIRTGQRGRKQLQDWLFGVRQRGFTNPGSDGLHVGILRNQVGVFVEALEEVGNATVLSNPSVLAVNRHPAQVLVGRKIGYQTLVTTETTTLQTVEFLEVGTSLVFRPFVSDDGYIRMEIHPESSDGTISATTGLPEESTTEVTTNVVVRSGHTVVIGGLMESQFITNMNQVPLLGSLPLIGHLFRSEEQLEVKNEIIVLLTPHVVGDSDLSRRADLARRKFESAQATLAASHYGYLRPAYARTLYGEAAAALADGHPDVALAKAEWGLRAMPADPDLAMLAAHCREELRAIHYEAKELSDAIELLEELSRAEEAVDEEEEEER
ncbi:MAG: hypothetical protein DWQ01_20000 [Planctomycetota bacterium]|nr:MAG: hypothetical protein DWQ01_20000 [Planctomycetota bacterium]